MFNIHSKSPDDTYKLGQAMGKVLTKGDLILLSGDLGAGKTLLTKGIVSGLQGSPDKVRSPSYTYLITYNTQPLLYHFDVYLLDSYDDLFELGIEEILDQQSIVVIEWGDKFSNDFSKGHWSIDLRREQGNNPRERIIRVQAPNLEQAKELAALWQS